jgi:hypothetical protein
LLKQSPTVGQGYLTKRRAVPVQGRVSILDVEIASRSIIDSLTPDIFGIFVSNPPKLSPSTHAGCTLQLEAALHSDTPALLQLACKRETDNTAM